MSDKLTLKQLKAELDALDAIVKGMSPYTSMAEGPTAVSQETLDRYEMLEESMKTLRDSVSSLSEKQSCNETAIAELAQAAKEDMEALKSMATEEDVTERMANLYNRIESLEKELKEAKKVVTGLRADADSDMERRTSKEQSIEELRRQMDSIFSRMVKAESKASEQDSKLVDAEKKARDADAKLYSFQKEQRNERLLIAVITAGALGVSLVVLALTLAGGL